MPGGEVVRLTTAPDLPVLDQHMHLDPRGERAEAVKAFERAGGTHILLVHKPYAGTPPRDEDEHREAMATTLALADEAREATDVVVHVVAGPHPAELTQLLSAGDSLDEATEAYRAGLAVARELYEEGKTVAIGEIGRPHYEVEAEVMDRANELFREALGICGEVGAPAVLHTEAGDPATFEEWATWADQAGLDRTKVVKHFSPPLVTRQENHGIVPSLVASEDTLRDALERSNRFFMETDYMDDPDRPGAVLGPKLVPRRTQQLYEKEIMTEAAWEHIHIDLPKRVYGIETDA